MRKGIEPTKQTKRKLMTFCEEYLDEVYRPVRYCFVESFPFTKIGKVDYKALEKLAQNER